MSKPEEQFKVLDVFLEGASHKESTPLTKEDAAWLDKLFHSLNDHLDEEYNNMRLVTTHAIERALTMGDATINHHDKAILERAANALKDNAERILKLAHQDRVQYTHRVLKKTGMFTAKDKSDSKTPDSPQNRKKMGG